MPAASEYNGTERRSPRQKPNSDSTLIPPHDSNAEESVLGAMLISRDSIESVIDTSLRMEHFYTRRNAEIFSIIQEQFGQGLLVDAVTVAERLARFYDTPVSELLDDLTGMQIATPSTQNAARYAQIVVEKHTLRKLIEAGGEITLLGYSRPDNVAKAVDEAERIAFGVSSEQRVDQATYLTDQLEPFIDHLEMLSESKGMIGTPTGYLDLDGLLRGLRPGALYVLGARPAMGKTSLGLGIASHVALKAQRPAYLVSLEMNAQEVTGRLVCAEASVDVSNLVSGKIQERDWAKITKAIDHLAGAPVWIDDNIEMTALQIRARARRLKSEHGDLGIVVIDYLQLMTGRTSAENRQIEVAEISRALKGLARDLDVPVLALSQLSRGVEMRNTKRPMLSDLRESGAIEQDADVVMFLYREDDNAMRPARVAEVSVAKNRHGPTGLVNLAWIPDYARFDNLSRHDYKEFR